MAATTQPSNFNDGRDEDHDKKKDTSGMTKEPPLKRYKVEAKRRTPPLLRLPKYMLEDAGGLSQVRYPSRHPHAIPGVADYLTTDDRSNLRETSKHFAGALPLVRPKKSMHERLGPNGEFCTEKKNLTADEAVYCRSKWPFIAVRLAKDLYERVKDVTNREFEYMIIVGTPKLKVNIGVWPRKAIAIRNKQEYPYTSWSQLQTLILQIAERDMNPEVVYYREFVNPINKKITI